jgi:predicted nucleic acid-binding protein
MLHGVDTSFLVAVTQPKHAAFDGARALLEQTVRGRGKLALAPQVLAEFIHVVTDERRFSSPLPLTRACDVASKWWEAREVVRVFPDAEAMKLFFEWMAAHALGRKRILDTMLAATFTAQGVSSILTLNERDFRIFGGFALRVPETAP